MFIPRTITTILAVIGYILAGTLLFLGFSPVTYPNQQKLELSSILDCKPTIKKYKLSELTTDEITNLKSTLGSTSPIEVIRDLASSVESVSTNVGSTTKLNIEYCEYKSPSGETLSKINSELNNKKKYYEFGTVDQFVSSFNQLPFVKLTNIKVDVASTFVRSNVCNKPINKSDFYIFTVIPNVTGSTQVAMYTLSLESDPSASLIEKFSGNLTTSGHYFKANLTCNG